jgi:hypothetical protein
VGKFDGEPSDRVIPEMPKALSVIQSAKDPHSFAKTVTTGIPHARE